MTSTLVTIISILIAGVAFGFLFLLVCVLPIYFIVLMPIIDCYTARKTNQKWLNWATIQQYWSAHTDCKTKDGTKCYHCASRNIRQYGYESREDTKRYHQCNQCNTILYRTGEVGKS